MLDHARMAQCIEDTVATALRTHASEHHNHAVEQLRAGVTLGFIKDHVAAEYISLLQNGERRLTTVTYPQILRIPQHAAPDVSGSVAA